MQRPNVLLVIADDHRADAIGAMGCGDVRTPNLDALARDGVAFPRAHIMGALMAAVCSPSRACLLTGRGLARADAAPGLAHGPQFEVRLAEAAVTLPQRFREAGYETFFTGKWHNDIASLLRSFAVAEDVFHGGMSDHAAVPVRDREDFETGRPPRTAAGFSTDIFGRAAERFLLGCPDDRPFFACVAFTSPHDPRTPLPEFRRGYAAERIGLPRNFAPEHPFDNGELMIRDERLVPKPLEAGRLREEWAAYYGMISHHDAWIGRLRDALAATGAAKNTLIVYVSDHGLGLGSHGLLGKQNLYEPSIRIPLIFQGPGVPAGIRPATLAYSYDLFATLCELAGVEMPPGADSRSLVPAMRHPEVAVRQELGALYMGCQRAMIDGHWKLIVYCVDGLERRQLFDLETDPDEMRDLAGISEHASRVAELRARLHRWQHEIGDSWWLGR